MNILNKLLQITLLFVIIVLIFVFYFYIPSIKNKNISKSIDKIEKNQILKSKNKNIFENVEYISSDTTGRQITTQASSSYFYQNNPGLVYLNNPVSFTIMNDGSILKITAKNGSYDKISKNATYKNQVKITNKKYIINSAEAMYLVKENKIKLNGNVIIQDPPNKIFSDKAILDTITNNAEVFMNSPTDRVLSQKYK